MTDIVFTLKVMGLLKMSKSCTACDGITADSRRLNVLKAFIVFCPLTVRILKFWG